MPWAHLIATFFAGVFFTNAIPHFISGVMGRPFQSPFADPPGKGLSSATVNVLWGFANLVFFWLLAFRATHVDVTSLPDVLAFGAGMLAMGLFCAHHFGPFHGGDLSRPS